MRFEEALTYLRDRQPIYIIDGDTKAPLFDSIGYLNECINHNDLLSDKCGVEGLIRFIELGEGDHFSLENKEYIKIKSIRHMDLCLDGIKWVSVERLSVCNCINIYNGKLTILDQNTLIIKKEKK